MQGIRFTFLLWLSLSLTTQSQAYELPPSFVTAIQSASPDRLQRLSGVLEARVQYLQYHSVIRDHYVYGLPASQDRSEIEDELHAVASLSDEGRRILDSSTSLSESEVCKTYFTSVQSAYTHLFQVVDRILETPAMGTPLRNGQFWKRADQTDHIPLAPSIPLDQARDLAQAEFLFQIITLLDALPEHNQEAGMTLFQTPVEDCFQTTRTSYVKVSKKRLRALLRLQSRLLGVRGVWDVQSLGNLFVERARTRARNLGLISMGMGVGTIAAIFLAPVAGAYLGSQAPVAGAGIMSSLKAMAIVGGIYFGAKFGVEVYHVGQNLLNRSPLPHDANEQAQTLLENVLSLPEDPLTLALVIDEYESNLHLQYVKLSPRENAMEWMPGAIDRFGSLQEAQDAYHMQKAFIDKELDIKLGPRLNSQPRPE